VLTDTHTACSSLLPVLQAKLLEKSLLLADAYSTTTETIGVALHLVT